MGSRLGLKKRRRVAGRLRSSPTSGHTTPENKDTGARDVESEEGGSIKDVQSRGTLGSQADTPTRCLDLERGSGQQDHRTLRQHVGGMRSEEQRVKNRGTGGKAET